MKKKIHPDYHNIKVIASSTDISSKLNEKLVNF